VTTSEFIIGHSVDDATEKKTEVRKILWALLAALFLHLLIGLGIARFSGIFSSPIVVEEDKPVELTMVDLSTPPPADAKKNTMFMATDEKKPPVEAPKEKTFESNANSIAASQQPATGDAPLPSQQGKDRPSVDLETHASSLARDGAQPQPSAVPEQTPQPTEPPKPTPRTTTPESEQFAMLTSTPTPSVQPTVASTPAPARSSYRPMKEQTRLSGSISDRGPSAVNALGTPLGRYQKLLNDAVGSRWYSFVAQKRELINIGTARLVFSVDRNGRVKNLKILQNTSNETFANVCLQSVMDIQLPPIPEDVANALPPEGLDAEMSFTMFANQ
jgi:outer membrane biosynthesis protein TonB